MDKKGLELYGYKVNKIPKEKLEKMELPDWVDKVEKTPIEGVLNRDIVVLDFVLLFSKKFSGQFAIILIALGPNEERKLITGSKVLLKQLEEYKEFLPFGCKIEKVNRYYTFRF